MTTVTFFNQNPPNTVFSPYAFESALNKEVPIYCNGLEMGTAKIIGVGVVSTGVYITYETEADLGIMLDIPFDLEDECTCDSIDYAKAIDCPIHGRKNETQ